MYQDWLSWYFFLSSYCKGFGKNLGSEMNSVLASLCQLEILEEGTSTEEQAPTSCPVGKSVVHFHN